MDLRLAVPAAAAWIAAAVFLAFPGAMPAVACGGWMLAVALLVVGRRQRFRGAVMVAVCCGAVALVLTSAVVVVPDGQPKELVNKPVAGGENNVFTGPSHQPCLHVLQSGRAEYQPNPQKYETDIDNGTFLCLDDEILDDERLR